VIKKAGYQVSLKFKKTDQETKRKQRKLNFFEVYVHEYNEVIKKARYHVSLELKKTDHEKQTKDTKYFEAEVY